MLSTSGKDDIVISFLFSFIVNYPIVWMIYPLNLKEQKNKNEIPLLFCMNHLCNLYLFFFLFF